jgi:hypothetical protein
MGWRSARPSASAPSSPAGRNEELIDIGAGDVFDKDGSQGHLRDEIWKANFTHGSDA